jgi:serine phosphatase RsbU (regulator of sigma subunit)/ligand-binding sensor domain-containing protein
MRRKFWFRLAVGAAVYLLGCQCLFGQLKFEHITIRDGLSQSSVRDILQDSRGFLWFVTVDGLNMYDGYDFTIYRTDQGDATSISSNFLRTICEDWDGNLWIGTNGEGLNRLDWKTGKFFRLRNSLSNPDSLSHDVVRDIVLGREGEIWIGTEGGGLNKMERGDHDGLLKFTRYMSDAENPYSLSSDRIYSLCYGREGILWIGTDGGGLNRFDPKTETFTIYRNDPDDPHSISNDYIRTVFEDSSGAIWIGTFGGGLNRLEKEGNGEIPRGRFDQYRFAPGEVFGLSSDYVLTVFQDRNANLWVGTSGGGVCKMVAPGIFIQYSADPGDPFGLNNDIIYSIYQDRSGVLWFGTENGGVNKLMKNSAFLSHIRKIPNNPNSLNDNPVWSIYQERPGLLWVGTRSGGLNRLKRDKYGIRSVTHYLHNPDDPFSIGHNRIRFITKDQFGTLWVGTDGGGLARMDPDMREAGKFKNYRYEPENPYSIGANRVYTICQDRYGDIWIGTRGGGISVLRMENRSSGIFDNYRHDPDDPGSLSHDFVYTIFEDREGTVWIGTFAGGLNRFNRETRSFTSYRFDVHDPTTICNNAILSIYEDKSGTLWLGTGGGGLNKLDRVRGVFSCYRVGDGLPNDVIYGILEEEVRFGGEDGVLWLSTNRGLCRFNPSTGAIKNYSEKDGLPSDEFNGNAYFKSPVSGEMFFGGIEGMVAFFPDKIKENEFVPPVVITSVLKLNKKMLLPGPVSELGELELSYKDYLFSFTFAALDFTTPRNNRYAYKMEGIHEDWIYTDSMNRRATFTTLPPGEYVFRVKGSNNDNKWNDVGVALNIVIKPPFWQTLWFKLIAGFFIVTAAGAFYRSRVKEVYLRTRMRTELETAHTAQMSIMPQQDPDLEGYDVSGMCLPANEVGGDFFDYICLKRPDSCFGIVVGDVSGKAMKAAMAAVMSDGMIYLKASESESITDILNQLNNSLYHKTDHRIFTAVCIVSLASDTNTLHFVNAGLPDPVLKRDGEIKTLRGGGTRLPVGIVKNTVYEEDSISLRSGDVLVLLTDGITESYDQQEEFYGTGRLHRFLKECATEELPARRIVELILGDIRKFTGEINQSDDMTVVVLKVL